MNTIAIITLAIVAVVLAAVAVTLQRRIQGLRWQQRNALVYAQKVARSIYVNHYWYTSPHWEEGDNLCEVISQIDNMLTGLVRGPE